MNLKSLTLSSIILFSGCLSTNNYNPNSLSSRHNKNCETKKCIDLAEQISTYNLNYSPQLISKSHKLYSSLPIIHKFQDSLDIYLNELNGKVWIIPKNKDLTDLPPWKKVKNKSQLRTIYAPNSKQTKLITRLDDAKAVFQGLNLAISESYFKNTNCQDGGIKFRSQIHEFSHMLQYVTSSIEDDFDLEVNKAFFDAKKRNIFLNNYSRTDDWEYFAEGVVAYLNKSSNTKLQIQFDDYVNLFELKAKDQSLCKLVKKAFDICKQHSKISSPNIQSRKQ